MVLTLWMLEVFSYLFHIDVNSILVAASSYSSPSDAMYDVIPSLIMITLLDSFNSSFSTFAL